MFSRFDTKHACDTQTDGNAVAYTCNSLAPALRMCTSSLTTFLLCLRFGFSWPLCTFSNHIHLLTCYYCQESTTCMTCGTRRRASVMWWWNLVLRSCTKRSTWRCSIVCCDWLLTTTLPTTWLPRTTSSSTTRSGWLSHCTAWMLCCIHVVTLGYSILFPSEIPTGWIVNSPKVVILPASRVTTTTTTTDLCPQDFFGDYLNGKTSLDLLEQEWLWHQLGHVQICTLPQTDNLSKSHHSVFVQAGWPSCCPANSIKALKARLVESLTCKCQICWRPSVTTFWLHQWHVFDAYDVERYASIVAVCELSHWREKKEVSREVQ